MVFSKRHMPGWTEALRLGAQVEINQAKRSCSRWFFTGSPTTTELATHVGSAWRTFSDAGSIPAASTNPICVHSGHIGNNSFLRHR